MRNVRPDRVVRLLTTLASLAYFGFWVGAGLVLTALPAVKLAGGSATGFHYSLELPVTIPNLETMVQTGSGPAPLKLDDVRAELQLPIPMLPWPLVAVLWTYTAVAAALMLLFLHNLRRIFQRVRDGAAFDAQNASRLRTLSVLLVALAMLRAVAEVATSIAVRRGLATGSSFAVPPGLHIDLTLVSVALVLMALAEVFRRGAELEDEQSLVV
jgi:hypothetical protein